MRQSVTAYQVMKPPSQEPGAAALLRRNLVIRWLDGEGWRLAGVIGNGENYPSFDSPEDAQSGMPARPSSRWAVANRPRDTRAGACVAREQGGGTRHRRGSQRTQMSGLIHYTAGRASNTDESRGGGGPLPGLCRAAPANAARRHCHDQGSENYSRQGRDGPTGLCRAIQRQPGLQDHAATAGTAYVSVQGSL